MTHEKRAFKRSPIELAASFGIPEESMAMHHAQVTNISYGGFSFESAESIPVGKKIQLSVELSKKEQAVLNVQVVWVNNEKDTNSYTIGVKIDHPSAEEYEKLAEFLSHDTD